MGVFAVDFRGKGRNWWGLLFSNRASFEGRRDGGEGQGAGVVQRVWTGVEMWERGLFGDRDPTTIRCPMVVVQLGVGHPSEISCILGCG
jgi:hypothetical protein